MVEFVSFEDVQMYFEGGSITCLDCGREYRRLEVHLLRKHKITGDEYKISHGLPLSRGLCCTESSALTIRHNKNLYKKGNAFSRVDKKEASLLAKKIKKRKKPEYTKTMCKDRLERGNKTIAENTSYPDAAFELLLIELVKGRKLKYLFKEYGLPAKCVFYNYMRKNKEYRDRFHSSIDRLSFSEQFDIRRRFSPEIDVEINRLLDDGYLQKDIARKLGVSDTVISRRAGRGKSRRYRDGIKRT